MRIRIRIKMKIEYEKKREGGVRQEKWWRRGNGKKESGKSENIWKSSSIERWSMKNMCKYVPSCAIMIVRVRQCTVLETTINDCSTTAPLALVQILRNVATAFACHGTVSVPISCSWLINLQITGTIKWICGRNIPNKKKIKKK